MRIKTFEFVINDTFGNMDALSVQHSKHSNNPDWWNIKPTSAAEIDKIINTFLDGKKVFDIKVSQYTANSYNDGHDNIIVERFTIMYTEG